MIYFRSPVDKYLIEVNEQGTEIMCIYFAVY